MKIGSFLGIDIILNRWLILLMIITALMGYVYHVAVLIAVIFIHEMSHAVTARAFGLYVSDVELMPFGGVAHVEALFEGDAKTELAVALAGPVANLIIISIITALNSYDMLDSDKWAYFISCNVILAVFNLLPGLPLDGGRILRALLSIPLGIKKATVMAVNTGRIIAAILCAIGIYILISGTFNPTFLVMGIFMFMSLHHEKQKGTYLALQDITRKKETMMRSGTLPIVEIASMPSATIKDVMRHFISNKYNVVVVIDRDGKIKGYVGEIQIVNALMDYGPNVIMNKLI
ncbi:site-2 protease family protein [Mahella sp.]|uniref:site-2 protease family protein n=1 Tax=Mahella sp. TaxID=2798721 RepID=UPI0025B84E00|nr:site-2 protease family protein [Mahella sp.]MBZ4666089.1 peptidase [Mahella sp.]